MIAWVIGRDSNNYILATVRCAEGKDEARLVAEISDKEAVKDKFRHIDKVNRFVLGKRQATLIHVYTYLPNILSRSALF